jgi:hypothetical protein
MLGATTAEAGTLTTGISGSVTARCPAGAASTASAMGKGRGNGSAGGRGAARGAFKGGGDANAAAASFAEGRAEGSAESIRPSSRRTSSGKPAGISSAHCPVAMRWMMLSVEPSGMGLAPHAMHKTAARENRSDAGVAGRPRARSGDRYGAMCINWRMKRSSPRRSVSRLAMTSGMSQRMALPSGKTRMESADSSPWKEPSACTVASASSMSAPRRRSAPSSMDDEKPVESSFPSGNSIATKAAVPT